MCVRYAVVDSETERERLERVRDQHHDFEMPGDGWKRDRFPGDVAAYVAHGGEVVEGRWGLQPAWAKDPHFGRKNAYNARAETVAEKPTFRTAYRHRRCVVPAAAFYERAEGRWLRVLPREGSFAIAGLFEEGTFTMVTTEPNLAIAELHDRMPVILDPSDVAGWLDPEADPRELHALLVPCPPEWTTVEDAGSVGGRRTLPDPCHSIK